MIAKLWNWLFCLCKHEWVTERVIKVYRPKFDDPVGYEYVLQCKKCGNIKQVKV